MEKKISKKIWFSAGRTGGFALGFSINKFQLNFELGFWYIGLEY
jgi:hypothetical protein